MGSLSPQKICEGCSLFDLFSERDEALISAAGRLARLNPATGNSIPVVDLSGVNMRDASLSPDGRKAALTVARPDGTAALYVAPLSEPPVSRDAWIQVAEDRYYLSRGAWSPDGKRIYYESSRDDHNCIWTQRVSAAGKPEGAPAAVLHFHESFQSTFYGAAPFALSADKLYVLLADVKGNAWAVNVDRSQ